MFIPTYDEDRAVATYLQFKTMPQVDKATFLPIVFWTFILYVGGFLFLNSTALFSFLSSLKLASKRALRKYTTALIGRRQLSNFLLFPWISL